MASGNPIPGVIRLRLRLLRDEADVDRFAGMGLSYLILCVANRLCEPWPDGKA
jgi:hypothetical protein